MTDTRAEMPKDALQKMRTMPSKDTWQTYAEIGEQMVKDALCEDIIRRLNTQPDFSDQALWLPFLMGCCSSLGGLIASMVGPDNRDFEEMAIGTFRGAIRKKDAPVNEDGSDWIPWSERK